MTPLFERPETLQFFRELLGYACGQSQSIFPFSKLMHWQSVRNTLSCVTPELDQSRALLSQSFFYNFSRPAFDPHQAHAEFARHNADVLLIPCIRQMPEKTENDLLNSGFIKIPWFVESVFNLNHSPEYDLRQRLGGKQFRDLRRLHNSSARHYDFVWKLGRAEISHQDLQMASKLHANNAAKYRHPIDLYTFEVLEKILESHLGNHLLLGFRIDKESDLIVQIAIAFTDPDNKTIYYSVLGKDYSIQRPGENLFISIAIDFFFYAEKNGYEQVFLGRGNQFLKQKVGADEFHILSNWLYTADPRLRDQILMIKSAMEGRVLIP